MICAACNEPVPAPADVPVAPGASLVAPGVSPGAQSADLCPACGQDPLLDGRYRLETVLGTGSTGTTYRATSTAEQLVFAVKEIPLRGTSPKARELAEREARVLSELDHPGVPRYREAVVAGTGRGRALWVVQEFVDGVDLHTEMQRHRYAEGEVLDVLDELLGILAYLHSRTPPVVHRDVKPKNVMRRSGQDGGIVLVDFGAVRDALKGELGGSTVAGTFGYMAPEQFQGDATPATDLYGVGALAVALLTRKEPHTMLDGSQRLRWERHAVLSPATARLLHELLTADPTQRPRSADEARARVREAKRALARGAQPVPVTTLELAGPALQFKEPAPAPEFHQPPILRGPGNAPATVGAGVARPWTVVSGVLIFAVVTLITFSILAAAGLAGLGLALVSSPATPTSVAPPVIVAPAPQASWEQAVRDDPEIQRCLADHVARHPDQAGGIILVDTEPKPDGYTFRFESIAHDGDTGRCITNALLKSHLDPPVDPAIGIYSFSLDVPR